MIFADDLRAAWAALSLPKPSNHFNLATPQEAIASAQKILEGFNQLIPADTFISISHLNHLSNQGVDTSALRRIWERMEENPDLAFKKVRATINRDNAITLLQEAKRGNCDELHYALLQFLQSTDIKAFGLCLKQKSGPHDYNGDKQHVFVAFNTDGKDLDYILNNPTDPKNIIIDPWFRNVGDFKSMLHFYKEAFRLDRSIDAVFIGDRDNGYHGDQVFFSRPRLDFFTITDGLASLVPYRSRNPVPHDDCNF